MLAWQRSEKGYCKWPARLRSARTAEKRQRVLRLKRRLAAVLRCGVGTHQADELWMAHENGTADQNTDAPIAGGAAHRADAGGERVETLVAAQRKTDQRESFLADELTELTIRQAATPNIPAGTPEELGDHVDAKSMLFAGHRYQ